jgi:molybdenum cofactor synthesis domain-containing protein
LTDRPKTHLDAVSRPEAWRRLLDAWRKAGGPPDLEIEEIDVAEGLDRVLASPVFARRSVPHYRASAMDGIAVAAVDTEAAAPAQPLILREGQGFQWLDTGDPLPQEFDAVIVAESVRRLADGAMEIMTPAVPGQNVRAIGEDVAEGRLLLSQGRLLTPQDLAAAVNCGIDRLRVRRRPHVAVIPTGDELVPPHAADLQPGQIVESNSLLLRGMLQSRGAEVRVWPICRDDPSRLREVLIEALAETDLVLINAGSSAGRDDHTARVVAELGRTLVHGLAIKPGAPVILGVAQGKPVIGIPGYPVSAALICELIVWPLVDLLTGIDGPEQPTIQARLSRRLVSPVDREEQVRVNVARINGQWVAIPGARGASNLRGLIEADGWVVAPEGCQGLEAGTTVDVRLRRTKSSLERSLMVAGGGAVLDRLTCALAPATRLVVIPTDEQDALQALERGEAHVALLEAVADDLVTRHRESMAVVLVRVGPATWVIPREHLTLPGVDQLLDALRGLDAERE